MVDATIKTESEMSWQDYQGKTQITAQDVDMRHGATYAVMGLTNEAGEVAGVHKKVMRDRGGIASPMDIDNMTKELGDTLWYLAQVALQYNIPLGIVAQRNIEKLMDRHNRGVINGNGDHR